jgi:hypothetical protein
MSGNRALDPAAAASEIAGNPTPPNADGRHSVGDASRQACVERQIGRVRAPLLRDWPASVVGVPIADCADLVIVPT